MFGDVHTSEFDEWWRTCAIRLNALKEDIQCPPMPAIIGLSCVINSLLDSVHLKIKEQIGREPTIEEYKAKVAEEIILTDDEIIRAFLLINSGGYTREELTSVQPEIGIFEKRLGC